MANVDHPNGLRAVRHFSGGVVRLSEYRIAGAHATAMHSGDLVKSTGSGKEITRAAAGNTAVGVFYGCEYVTTEGDIVFSRRWPASQAVKSGSVVKAWVYDDPNIVFEIQGDEDIVAADIGGVADVVVTAGDDTTGVSKMELDSSSIAASGSAQLKILGFVDRDDNEQGVNFARVEVLINEHELKAAMTAV